jgi:hypothetical protein
MNGLVEHIATLVDEAGGWEISSEDAAERLGVDAVRFWRAVHDVQDRISFADAIDGWSQETVGDLVTVLEHLLGPGPEEEMIRAGLFLSSPLGIELIEELLFRARRMGAAHEIRAEEFAAMLRHTGTVRAAVDIYLDEYTAVDELVDGAAESFRVLHDMPPRARATARRYLARMMARHVVDRRGLLTGLVERLRLEAARLGFVDPEDRARGPAASGTGEESSRRAWARRVMGIDGPGISAEALRSRYRRLMMRHHPDVDPAGLERCKDVNSAYALLISDYTAAS